MAPVAEAAAVEEITEEGAEETEETARDDDDDVSAGLLDRDVEKPIGASAEIVDEVAEVVGSIVDEPEEKCSKDTAVPEELMVLVPFTKAGSDEGVTWAFGDDSVPVASP